MAFKALKDPRFAGVGGGRLCVCVGGRVHGGVGRGKELFVGGDGGGGAST